MSKEDLIEVLRSVMYGTEPKEALANLIPESQRNVVITMHTLYCTRDHKNEGGCTFYTEQDWNEDAHKLWIKIVDDMMKETNADVNTFNRIMPYLCKLEDMRKTISKEVGEQGLALFNYLLRLSD